MGLKPFQPATNRVAAGLVDDDPVGEGLIMGLDVERPLLSVQGVFLDEVHIVHPCDLQMQHTHGSGCCSGGAEAGSSRIKRTRFSRRGASTSRAQRRSILWEDPSSLVSSLVTSLATNMGMR